VAGVCADRAAAVIVGARSGRSRGVAALRPCAGATRRVGDAPRRPYLLGRAGVWGEGCLLPRPFCYAPCRVAGALPYPATLSAAKFANRPCARLAEALREAGRMVASQEGVAPLR